MAEEDIQIDDVEDAFKEIGAKFNNNPSATTKAVDGYLAKLNPTTKRELELHLEKIKDAIQEVRQKKRGKGKSKKDDYTLRKSDVIGMLIARAIEIGKGYINSDATLSDNVEVRRLSFKFGENLKHLDEGEIKDRLQQFALVVSSIQLFNFIIAVPLNLLLFQLRVG